MFESFCFAWQYRRSASSLLRVSVWVRLHDHRRADGGGGAGRGLPEGGWSSAYGVLPNVHSSPFVSLVCLHVLQSVSSAWVARWGICSCGRPHGVQTFPPRLSTSEQRTVKYQPLESALIMGCYGGLVVSFFSSSPSYFTAVNLYYLQVPSFPSRHPSLLFRCIWFPFTPFTLQDCCKCDGIKRSATVGFPLIKSSQTSFEEGWGWILFRSSRVFPLLLHTAGPSGETLVRKVWQLMGSHAKTSGCRQRGGDEQTHLHSVLFHSEKFEMSPSKCKNREF